VQYSLNKKSLMLQSNPLRELRLKVSQKSKGAALILVVDADVRLSLEGCPEMQRLPFGRFR
jgi:hypothetical protein